MDTIGDLHYTPTVERVVMCDRVFRFQAMDLPVVVDFSTPRAIATVVQILVRRLIEQITALDEMREYEEDLGVYLPPETVKSATVLITIGPIILLYPFVQKHFIKGIMIGSLKG